MLIWGLSFIFKIMMALGIYGIVGAAVYKNRCLADALKDRLGSYYCYDIGAGEWWMVLVIGAVLLVLLWVIVLITYMSNKEMLARWKAVKEANVPNHRTAVSMTQKVLSDTALSEAALVDGSLERQAVGERVTDRILEYRQKANSFNAAIAGMRAMRDVGWLLPGSLVMPPIPDDEDDEFGLIKIEKIEE